LLLAHAHKGDLKELIDKLLIIFYPTFGKACQAQDREQSKRQVPAGHCNAGFHLMKEFQPISKRHKPELARLASLDTSLIAYDGLDLVQLCRKLRGTYLLSLCVLDVNQTLNHHA
jgi:membrane-associated PAP2 superfamily phosphatase